MALLLCYNIYCCKSFSETDFLFTFTDTEYVRYSNGNLTVTDVSKNTTRVFPVSEDIMVTHLHFSELGALSATTEPKSIALLSGATSTINLSAI